MAGEYQALIRTLKRTLKDKKITYKALADEMGISEQTLKRFFTQEDGSVGRIAEICDIIGVNFFRLTEFSNERKESQFTLSLEQESFLVNHLEVYGFFLMLVRGRTVEQIAQEYSLSDLKVKHLLRRMEENQLLVRLAYPKVQLLFKGAHNWLDNGPLGKAFGKSMAIDLVDYCFRDTAEDFEEESEFKTYSIKRVSPQTFKSMVSEMMELLKNFRRRSEIDQTLLPYEDLVPIQWLVSMVIRPVLFEQSLKEYAKE